MAKNLKEKIIEVLNRAGNESFERRVGFNEVADQILEVIRKDTEKYPMWIVEKGKKPRLVKEKTPAEQEILEEIKKFKVVSGIGSYRKIKSWQEKLKW